MEISAGIAAWCGGLCIVAAEEIPRPLVILTSLAFVALILCRPTSSADALVVLVVLGTLGGWHHVRQRARNVGPLLATLVISLVVAICFLVVLGTPSLLGIAAHPPLSWSGNVSLTLRLMGGQLRQTIGAFGWLDILAPTWVTVLWVAAIGALVGYTLVISRRARRALPLLALAIFAYPFIFETPQLNTVGPYWQGRYWLPIAVGLPLVAAAVLPALRRSWILVVGVLLGTAQLVAFVSTLGAYVGHPVRPGSSTSWMPPGGSPLTIALFVAGQVLLVGFVLARHAENASPRHELVEVPSTP